MKPKRAAEDPLARIREAQDHRLDPGFFTGGQVDPLLTGPRPNPYGWYLLGSSLLGGLFTGFALHERNAYWLNYVLLGSLMLLGAVAGVRLLRSPRRHERRARGSK